MSEQKEKLSKEAILEIIVAIMLGVTALLTSWASWIGSLHGGNQATNYTTSNNLAADGNARWNEAAQNYMQDMMTWNQINEAAINSAYAEAAGNMEDAEKYDYVLEQLMGDNCTEEFLDAIAWAFDQQEATGEMVSPFEMEGFVDSYFADAADILAQSEEILEQGKQDNTNGDKFGLVTVIYSVVLFLLGIVGTFKNLPNRYIVLGVAVVAFLIATIFMFTIPMPTGFDFASYFQ